MVGARLLASVAIETAGTWNNTVTQDSVFAAAVLDDNPCERLAVLN